MIWIRLLALMLVVFTTVPLIVYSLQKLLVVSSQRKDDLDFSLFATTSMTFVYYLLLVLSVSGKATLFELEFHEQLSGACITMNICELFIVSYEVRNLTASKASQHLFTALRSGKQSILMGSH